jgi:HAD superfamily hydrolase (TIGR01509 family)
MSLAVIFDMDGVLLDTVALAWRGYNEVLGEYGAHVPNEEIGKLIGMATREQMKILRGEYDLPESPEVLAQKASKRKKELQAVVPALPGARELCAELKRRGVRMAVGTSSGRAEAERMLTMTGLRGYFELLVTGDDVEAHKPAPDTYVECARLLGVQPEQCVVIEDAPSGIKAAHGAGIACVAVQSPFAGKARLAEAELVVKSLRDLTVEMLETLTR